MKAIWLKTLLDLRARRAAVLVIAGTIAVVAGILTVAVAMTVNGFTFMDRLHADTNGADIWLQMSAEEIGWIEDGRLALPAGTRRTDAYPMGSVVVENEKEIVPLAIALPTGEQPEVGRLRIVDGQYLSADDPFGVVIDNGMAVELGLGIGDEVVLRRDDVTVTATVRGTAADTIHLPYPSWNPTNLYVTPEASALLLGEEGPKGLLVGLKLPDPAASGQVLNDIRNQLPDSALVMHGGYDFVWMKGLTTMVNAIPLVFVAAFTLFGVIAAWMIVGSVVSAQVLAQTREIGILKALGFTPRQVRAVYLLQSTIIAAIAAAIGAAGGSFVAQHVSTHMVRVTGGNAGGAVTPAVFMTVVLALTALVCLAAYLPARRGGRILTVQALTFGADAPRSRGNSLLSRLASWGVPVPLAMGLRDALARPGRTIVAVTGMTFAVAAVAYGLVLNHTINMFLVDPSIFMGFRPQVALAAGERTPDEMAALLGGFPEVETYYHRTWLGKQRYESANADMYVRSVGGPFGEAPVNIQEGRNLAGPLEAIVGKGLLDMTGLSVGDTLTLTFAGNSLDFTIVGRYFDPDNMGRQVVVRHDDIAPYTSEVPFEYGLGLAPGADPDDVRARLEAALAGDGRAIIPDEALPKEAIDLQPLMFWLPLALGAIALISLFNTFLLSVMERRRELGMLKAQGMTPAQVAGAVSSTGIWFGLAAAVLGIPGGVAAAKLLLLAMTALLGSGEIQTFVPWGSLVLVAPVTLVLSALAGLVPALQAGHTPVVTVLRAE